MLGVLGFSAWLCIEEVAVDMSLYRVQTLWCFISRLCKHFESRIMGAVAILERLYCGGSKRIGQKSCI